MVWFARWRKKWKTIVIATAIATSLAATAQGIHEWRQYAQAKDATTQIVQLEYGIRKYEKVILRVYKELGDANEYKSQAEKLVKEGRIEESKKNYKYALYSFKAAEDWLWATKIKNARVKLAVIKRDLVTNSYFNPRSNEVISVEGSINAAIKNADELFSSISEEIKNIEGILHTL